MLIKISKKLNIKFILINYYIFILNIEFENIY